MPSHYLTILDQLVEDIRSVIGSEAEICFGRPRRPMEYPNAVILTKRLREFTGQGGGPRRLEEGFEFDIAVKLKIEDIDPYPEYGGEVAAFASADLLINVLAPNSLTAVPSPAGLYAGVGNPRYVPNVEYLESGDDDAWVGYRLTFQTVTTVYQ